MSLKFHFHPLASFCHKVLIALYENGTPFEPVIVDLGDPASTAAFRAVWPMARMPVLTDEARASTVAESTILIEYLDLHYPGAVRLLPGDPDAAWRTRMWDRFFDNYIHQPMQKIVGDRLRPPTDSDAFGVAQAREQLREAYAAADRELGPKRWMMGEVFSLADCAAAPALFYANVVEKIAPGNAMLGAYLERLMSRPSYARVLSEAAPFMRNFPFHADLGQRYPGLYP